MLLKYAYESPVSLAMLLSSANATPDAASASVAAARTALRTDCGLRNMSCSLQRVTGVPRALPEGPRQRPCRDDAGIRATRNDSSRTSFGSRKRYCESAYCV